MYPLPDPRYLALHATVAKVVHAAGINMHLKDIVKKYDSTVIPRSLKQLIKICKFEN